MSAKTPYGDSNSTGPAQGTNEDIARMLQRTAELLRLQEANPFRVRSYERAADSIRELNRPLDDLYAQEGHSALLGIEHVGRGLAASLREILETGRFALLEHLESEAEPGAVLTQVPGIGLELGRRIHDELGVRTLEDLEQAAHDGRLARVEGFGRRGYRGCKTPSPGC